MEVWFWCSCCERAFRESLPNGSPMDFETGDYLEEPEMCPFELCPSEGHIWLWWKFRKTQAYYPSMPLFGVRYPLRPTREDVKRVGEVHSFIDQLDEDWVPW